MRILKFTPVNLTFFYKMEFTGILIALTRGRNADACLTSYPSKEILEIVKTLCTIKTFHTIFGCNQQILRLLRLCRRIITFFSFPASAKNCGKVIYIYMHLKPSSGKRMEKRLYI